MFLILGSILFWALFEQAGSSINLYTDRQVDRNILGYEVPASVFQSINSIYIITLGPLFAILWTLLGRRGLEPSTPAKFGLALVQLGVGFLILVAGAAAAGPSNRSEEHTSELQSLMRISYAVFCLKKKKYKVLIN